MSHVTRGTCNEPSCPDHGRCHCGCAGWVAVVKTSCAARAQRAGMPTAFCPGHGPGSTANRHLGPSCMDKRFVPLADIRWMALALIEESGGIRPAARATGLDTVTLFNIRRAFYPRVEKSTARRIRRAFARLDRPLRKTFIPISPKLLGVPVNQHLLGDRLAQAWLRAQRSGYLSVLDADELAVALGVHPFQLFGQAFYTEAS